MKTLLIGLRNEVPAFQLTSDQLDMLKSAVGDVFQVVSATNKEEFLRLLPTADQCVCWKFQADWYERCPKLTVIHTPAAGKDWIAPDPTGNVSVRFGSFHGRLLRESLVAMMLHFTRRLDLTVEDQKNKIWDRDRYSSLSTVYGSHVAIIGYGAIGRECASVLKAFGCYVTGIKRSMTTDFGPADDLRAFKELTEVLPTADHVVCILPGGVETENVLTPDHFSSMKPGAYLYNLGRGNCYREEDLVHALTNGPLAGAGLDVFATEPLPEDSSLWDMDNVLLMPHASAICKDYLTAYVEELISRLG